jgi:hypothetical protein
MPYSQLIQQTTHSHTPQDRKVHNHCKENLNSYKLALFPTFSQWSIFRPQINNFPEKLAPAVYCSVSLHHCTFVTKIMYFTDVTQYWALLAYMITLT